MRPTYLVRFQHLSKFATFVQSFHLIGILKQHRKRKKLRNRYGMSNEVV